jgi:transposase InsO family protein
LRDPYEIATWRYHQIAPLLDPTLTRAQRRRAIAERRRHATDWPNGSTKRIPKSTLYRWVKAYQQHGFPGLMPKLRCDRDRPRRDVVAWISFAIFLLLEQPLRTLFQLGEYLALQFQGYNLSRSSLARRLKVHPVYPVIKKLRGGAERLRARYEAKHPHESWQLDGKGPFRVRLMSGEVALVHVLTILDDFSRAVLAAVISLAEDTDAVIRVFQRAAERFGLCDRMQFDRGSAADSHAFRDGIALCGIHRNAVVAMNPQAQGKIEAFHKALQRWFIDELRVQQVRDLDHLQELLDAWVALLYQKHHHSGVRDTPEQRLAGRISGRRISSHDLARAFYVSVQKKSDKTTGEVVLPNGSFVVQKAMAGQSALFRYDPIRLTAVLVTKDRRELELAPFVIRPLPKPRIQYSRPQGQLQKLVDIYQGRERKNAEPAFGLPEVFLALQDLVSRPLPNAEAEATTVLAFWQRHGPIARAPFLKACEHTKRTLGPDRPLAAYLNHLERQIIHAQQTNDPEKPA